MSRVISSLDPWSYPVAIHWGDGITKLDFVGNRYMVRGQDQELADVLGEATRGMTQAQQLAYRTGVGLDLREPDSVFHLPVNPRRAFLKNKVNPPTKKDPGALNEFLYLGGTIVTEIDLVDVRGEFAKVGSNIGPYPFVHELLTHFRTDAEDNWRFFQIATPVELEITPGQPAKIASTTWTWTQEPTEGTYYVTEFAVGQDAEVIANYTRGGVPPEYVSDSTTGMIWVKQEFFGPDDPMNGPPGFYWSPHSNYDVPGDYAPPLPPYGVPRWFGPDAATPYPVTWEARPAIEEEIDFTASHNVAVFEKDDTNAIHWGRMIGATRDTQYGSGLPITNGALPGQWGRMRIAVTVTKGGLTASVNGSNPVVVRANPLFQIPVVPPIDPETGKPRAYFPIENATGPFSSGRKTYEIMMNFSGIVRCMWLHRRPKNLTSLQSLSVVKPLTPPDDPKWKKT